MSYRAPISRTNPACILFLIDQSRSMDEPITEGDPQTKAVLVADALNRLLQNIVLRSAKADGVRDYFRVGVIGYGKTVRAGLGGKVPFEVLVPVSRTRFATTAIHANRVIIPIRAYATAQCVRQGRM